MQRAPGVVTVTLARSLRVMAPAEVDANTCILEMSFLMTGVLR